MFRQPCLSYANGRPTYWHRKARHNIMLASLGDHGDCLFAQETKHNFVIGLILRIFAQVLVVSNITWNTSIDRPVSISKTRML
jgi:hypothetical protein